MGALQQIRRPRRKLCVGDLKDRVILQKRTLTEPTFGETEFDESFSLREEVWASIQTTAGKAFFAGVNVGDVRITHRIDIRYDVDVTEETWIELKDDVGTRLDIVDVEDLEERHEWMVLSCVERGPKDQEATAA